MQDAGRLLVCATPIGNLGDVTARVLEALKSADVIVAEDTRVTRRLLARYGIATPLERYDAHAPPARTDALVDRLGRGDVIALVSDAGTPGVSDPGAVLIEAALEAGVPVDVLPGPSAILTALVASGLPTHAFYFGGFLPRKAGERRRRLERLASLDATLVFYESPRRTASTAATLAEVLPGRRAAMARELTKLHEEVLRLPIGDLARALGERELKGEVVLLVGPPDRGTTSIEVDTAGIRRRIAELTADGLSKSAAVRQVADEVGVSRRSVYEIAHASEAERPGPAPA